MFLKANAKFITRRSRSRKSIPSKSLVKPDSQKLIPVKSLVKSNSRKLIPAKCLQNEFAKIKSRENFFP